MKISVNFEILWDSCAVDAASHYESCIHSGNAGDIIYSLPTVKMLGAEHFIINLCSDPAFGGWGGRSITLETARALSPLLIAQDYIKRVSIVKSNLPLEYLEGKINGVDFILDKFRLQNASQNHLLISHAKAFGINPNLNEKWLTTKGDDVVFKKDYIVIALTERYRTFTNNHWVSVLAGFPNIIAIGLPQDFPAMAGITGEFYTCNDFYEMAKIIAGAKVFIGNANSAYAVAEGLKIPRIIEAYQNAFPIGSSGYKAPISTEDTRTLIAHVSKIKPEYTPTTIICNRWLYKITRIINIPLRLLRKAFRSIING